MQTLHLSHEQVSALYCALDVPENIGPDDPIARLESVLGEAFAEQQGMRACRVPNLCHPRGGDFTPTRSSARSAYELG